MNFKEFVTPLLSADQIVFVGLGNESRGDDAAGLLFLNELRKQIRFKSATMINAGSNPENVLQPILDAQPAMVVFIDATNWGGLPGEMRWIDRSELDQIRISTHAFSIQMVEQYLKAHQPMQIRYLGIQYGSIHPGDAISEPIINSIRSFFNASNNW